MNVSNNKQNDHHKTITNMSQVTKYTSKTHKTTDDHNTVSTHPSSTGTIDTDTTTPPSSCPATPIPPAKPAHRLSAPAAPSVIGGPRPPVLGGRIRKRLASLKSRKEKEAQEKRENGFNKVDQEEEIFQKRVDILMKNPHLFQRFQARVRNAGYLTPVGVRFVLGHFLTDMKIVEVLEDLRIEQEVEEEPQQPRRRLGLFASFGYRRTSNSTSITCSSSSPSSSTITSNKQEKLQRSHMFRSSGRRHTGGSHCSTSTEADDNSAFSFESLGLTLPSLENTESQGGDTDDYSSVGSVSVSGWTLNEHRQNSLRSLNTGQNSSRSLNGGPSSARSLLRIPKEEEDDTFNL